MSVNCVVAPGKIHCSFKPSHAFIRSNADETQYAFGAVIALSYAEIDQLIAAGYIVRQTDAAGYCHVKATDMAPGYHEQGDVTPATLPTYPAPANSASTIAVTHVLPVNGADQGVLTVYRDRGGTLTTTLAATNANTSPQTVTCGTAAATGDRHRVSQRWGAGAEVFGAWVTT
jgi:hypothetical protein